MYCLSLIGYHNTHSILSISNDGWMCSWNPKGLSEPDKFKFLTVPKSLVLADESAAQDPTSANSAASQSTGSSSSYAQGATSGGDDARTAITAHALDFAEGEQETFYIGAEDYNIYQCNLRSDSYL